MQTLGLREKLIISIIGSAFLVLALTGFLTNMVARRGVEDEAKQRVQNLVRAEVNQMDAFLQSTARIAVVLADSVAVDVRNDEALLRARIGKIVEKNPEIYGATVAFEPYKFHSELEYFAPYYYHGETGVEYTQLGTRGYASSEWYTAPRDSEKLIWTSPHDNARIDGVRVATASYPVIRGGVFIGTAMIDVSLDRLGRTVQQLQVGGFGRAMMIDQRGNIIATSEFEQLQGREVADWLAEMDNITLQELMGEVLAGDEGLSALPLFSFDTEARTSLRDWWAVYMPVPSTEWRIVVFVAAAEMMSPVSRLAVIIGIISLLAMVVMGGIVIFISNTITKPLETLREEALLIAHGDLSRHIPVTSQDEIGAVGEAFNSMARELQSLVENLEKRVAQRTKELSRRADQLQAVSEVSQAVSSILDVDELLNAVVDLARQQFDLYYVGIFLVDEMQDYAWLRAGTGNAGKRMLEQRHKLKIGETSMIGWCVQHGEARIALDVGDDAVRFSNPLLPQTRSEMALPLRARGDEIIGAMTVQSTRERAFDHEDIVILQTMADQVASAISNAWLYAQTEAQLDEISKIHKRYLREEWSELVPKLPISGFDLRGQDMRPLKGTTLPELAGVTETVGARVIELEEQEVLVAPILLRGQTIGALGLQGEVGTRKWTEAEIALVDAVVQQLALTIENIKLLEDTQRRARRERTVSQIGTKLRDTTDLEVILQTAADELAQALNVPRSFIQLWTGSELTES